MQEVIPSLIVLPCRLNCVHLGIFLSTAIRLEHCTEFSGNEHFRSSFNKSTPKIHCETVHAVPGGWLSDPQQAPGSRVVANVLPDSIMGLPPPPFETWMGSGIGDLQYKYGVCIWQVRKSSPPAAEPEAFPYPTQRPWPQEALADEKLYRQTTWQTGSTKPRSLSRI